jgi:hypothetical protein
MLSRDRYRTRNRHRHGAAHADRVIENRINPPQKRPAESGKAVRKKVVQGVAFVDTSNFHTPALVFIVHMELFEPLAEFFLELLLQTFQLPFDRGDSLLKGRTRDDRGLIVLNLNRPAK